MSAPPDTSKLLDALSREVKIINLPSTSEAQLKRFINSKYGNIVKLNISTSKRNPSQPTRTAHVLFESIEKAKDFCNRTVLYEGTTLECFQLTIRKGEEDGGSLNCYYETDDGSLCFKYWRKVTLKNRRIMVFKLNQIIGKVELEIGEARSQFEINVTRPPQLYIETNRQDSEDIYSKSNWEREPDFTNGAVGWCLKYRFITNKNEGQNFQDKLTNIKLNVNMPLKGVIKRAEINQLPNMNGLDYPNMFIIHSLLSYHLIPNPMIGGNQKLTVDFIDKIKSLQDDKQVYQTLYDFCTKQQFTNNPCALLKNLVSYTMPEPNETSAWIHKVLITPTRILFQPPQYEVTNRVVRDYGLSSDCFLRVSFLDENLLPLNRGFSDSIRERFTKIMNEGINIGEHNYKYLGYSSSQLRQGSCWFLRGNSWKLIYQLGYFHEINVVPRFGARVGQCFTSTIPTILINIDDPEQVSIEKDIKTKDGKYMFSDGLGRISTDKANCVSAYLQLSDCPCAFQIRFAGGKGVLLVDPTTKNIVLRESMKKFEHRPRQSFCLEIVAYSRFIPVHLNRPLITILEFGGVPKSVFLQKQKNELSQIDAMLVSNESAIEQLQQYSGQSNAVTMALLLLKGGFSVLTEPFLRDFLSVFRAHRTNKIKTKAAVSSYSLLLEWFDYHHIFIPEACSMIGVLDETKTLKYGEIFVQINCPVTKQRKVITGPVLLYKNPVTHPGDVRKLQAVDKPNLRIWFDVVVFPAEGKRPHTSEASGSDLDGDEYCVIYDQAFVSHFKSSPPANYIPQQPRTGQVAGNKALIDWFLRYMKEDNLGILGMAHLALADKMAPNDRHCLELANGCSIAVDFAKTGEAAKTPPSHLRPDFLAKKNESSYPSKKALGELFRAAPQYQLLERIPILLDNELIVSGHEEFLEEARVQRDNYYEILSGILLQHGVSEIEAFSNCFIKLGIKRNSTQSLLSIENKIGTLHKQYPLNGFVYTLLLTPRYNIHLF